MTNDEKELLEGFNAGYLIEKHRPELSQILVNGLEVPYIEGFIAGSKEFVQERELIRSISKSREQSPEKGGIPRPTRQFDNNSKDKGFEIDR